MVVFTQDHRSDFDVILNHDKPFCLVRFGDGELSLVTGRGHVSADAWRVNGPTWIRGALIESLCCNLDGYAVGWVPPCCLQSGIRLRPAIRVPLEMQTFATIFLHANLRRFEEVMVRFSDAVIVNSSFGPEEFRIPADGVSAPWDIDGLVDKLAKAQRPILLAGGPLSNILAMRLWKRWKPEERQTVLDVGSALDALHGKFSRAFHVLKKDHVCSMNVEYVNAPRPSSRTRAAPAPQPIANTNQPQQGATRIGAARSVQAQPLPTRTGAGPRRTNITKVGCARTRTAPAPLPREVSTPRRTGAQSIRQVEGPLEKTRTREVVTRARPTPTEAIHVGRSVLRSRPSATPPTASPLVTAHATQLKAAAVIVTKRPWLAPFIAQQLAWQQSKPTFVLVASADIDYDITPIKEALPDAEVDLVPVNADLNLGELRNLAMSLAAEQVDDDTLLCTIDDDDAYGPDYLAGLLDAFGRHPQALIIGRASFQGIEVREPPTEPPPSNPRVRRGIVPGVAGSTISIPARAWRDKPEFRYPPVACGEDVALQAIARQARGIVSANFGDYAPLRWLSAEHQHTSPNNHGAVPLVLVQDQGHHTIRPCRSR